jgi:hypothetical protein
VLLWFDAPKDIPKTVVADIPFQPNVSTSFSLPSRMITVKSTPRDICEKAKEPTTAAPDISATAATISNLLQRPIIHSSGLIRRCARRSLHECGKFGPQEFPEKPTPGGHADARTRGEHHEL